MAWQRIGRHWIPYLLHPIAIISLLWELEAEERTGRQESIKGHRT